MRENRKCALSSPVAYNAADTNNSHPQKSICAAKVKLYPGTLFTQKYNTQAIISQTWESGRHFLGGGKLSIFTTKLQVKISFGKLTSTAEHENTLTALHDEAVSGDINTII